MKKKGFTRPIKYIFVGKPNLTKTTLAKKLGLSYFESDGIKHPLSLESYDLTKEIIILGGKYSKIASPVVDLLMTRLADYQVIILEFKRGN